MNLGLIGVNRRENPPTYQVFVRVVFKGEPSPPDQGDLGEDVALQQLLKQHLARFPGGSQDETAFILLPEVLLQILHVRGGHVVCHNKSTLCTSAANTHIMNYTQMLNMLCANMFI